MKSNFKRVVASISTIALAASTFAGFTITASAENGYETTQYYDSSTLKIAEGEGTEITASAKAAVINVDGELRVGDKTNGAAFRFDLSDYESIDSAQLNIKVAPRSYKESDARFNNTEIWTYKVNSVDWNATTITGDDWNRLSKGDPINKQWSSNYGTADPTAVAPWQDLAPVDVKDLIPEAKVLVFAFKASTAREHAIDATLTVTGTLKAGAATAAPASTATPTPAPGNPTAAPSNPTAAPSNPTAAPSNPTAAPGAVVPTGVTATVPYTYAVSDIDYGIGAVQSFNNAGRTFWTANAADNTVTFASNNAGVHFVDIDNTNNLGYPMNKIVLPVKSGFATNNTVLYVLKKTPALAAMENASSGAFAREATTNVKSFANVENQIWAHPDALEDINNPQVLAEEEVIARIVIKNNGNNYDVTPGTNSANAGLVTGKTNAAINYKDTAGKTYKAFVIDINTTTDDDGIPVSMYQDGDLMVYTANALGTFGPLSVDFLIPAERIPIKQKLEQETADYYSDHNEGIYYIGRANTNGLKSIDVKGNGQDADTIVKIFALSNKIYGEDEMKDFLHDYTHQETSKKGVYKNVKYDQLGKDVVIPAESDATVNTGNFSDPEVGAKFIYAVVMKKVPVAGGTSDITETGTDTAPIESVTYNYEARRYANAIKAEYLLLNTEVEDVVDADNVLIPGYENYKDELQATFDEIQALYEAGKTENVFTETYAAKWAKLRDEKEAMETIVAPIYEKITAVLDEYQNVPLLRLRDINADKALRSKAMVLRDDINELWQNYTRASIKGKSYVKDNNYDELKKAYDDLQKFYDDVIADYTDSINKIYDLKDATPIISQKNYLGEEGHELAYLKYLVDDGQYDFDKELIAKKVSEAINPDKGGMDVSKIVNDLYNVVSTFIPVTRDEFDALYENFVAKYEKAAKEGTPEDKKKAIDDATELAALVEAIEGSAFAEDIRDAIGTDYRYSWANKVDNFEKFQARSTVVDLAKTYIDAANESSKLIDDDKVGGISQTSYDTIIDKYWDASEAAETFHAFVDATPEARTVLDEFGLTADVNNADKEMNESWLYVQRAAEIVAVSGGVAVVGGNTTADLMAALDDIANDAAIAVTPANQAKLAAYMAKVKYARKTYDALTNAHAHLDTFLNGYSNEYFPFAQKYDAPAASIDRSKNANKAVNYAEILANAEKVAKDYADEALAQFEDLYNSNIDKLEDYIATLSFRDIVFDNFKTKYDEMATVYRDLVKLNNIYRFYNSNDLTGNAGSSNISRTNIDLKNLENDITTEVLSSYSATHSGNFFGINAAASHPNFVDFDSKFKKYENFIDTITWDVIYDNYDNKTKKHRSEMSKSTALYEEDQDLIKAVQNMMNELGKGEEYKALTTAPSLSDFALGKEAHEYVEAVEDYIISTIPDPSAKVEDLLAKIDAAITAHKRAVVAYGNAYVNIGGHSVTDFTTGNNSSDDPGANKAPDYYYDLDPIKYTGVYFTKRDVDAWDLRLRPVIETALDARAGYDAASIADTMLMIPDKDITIDNYHDFDDTVIPAHELYERARQATKDKIQKDYADAYNHYLAKWNQYVAANNEVANAVAEYTNKAKAEADAIAEAIMALYNKVTDPETVYNTVEEVEADLDTIFELEKRIDDDINDANGDYTYLNRNYFLHEFKIEDHEPRIWTIESILDDWHKCIPVIDRARFDYENLDIVDDLDETNVKVGYEVVVHTDGDDLLADDEMFALRGEFNTIRDHGGTIFARTAYDMMNNALFDAEFKYYAYRYATDFFGTPAYNIPANLNFYNVDENKDDVQTLYDFYRSFGQDEYSVGGIEPLPGTDIYAQIHKTVEEFFMDEVEKINRLYDVLYNDRPAGKWFDEEMSDYEAALEFNQDLANSLNGVSTLSDDDFYEKYLELLANHPKAVPFLNPTLYAWYLSIVGDRDELMLTKFTNAVKNLDYGSYANPWGMFVEYMADHKTPDETKSEANFQAAYEAAADLYDDLSSNAKDAVADPEVGNKIQQDANKAYTFLTEVIPVWHADFVAGYKDAAIASGYAAIANNYRGIITEANYKDAKAAYDDAEDARKDLEKYPAHNLYQADVKTDAGFTFHVNPNFDDITRYAQYADQYESDVTEGLTATLKSAVGEQLKKTEDVMATEKKINEIGTVTVASGKAIDDARKAYEQLSPAYQSAVKNYTVLLAAEKAYAALDEVVNAKAYAGPAIEAINAIGTVTRQSGDAIKDARAKFDALSDLSKTFVSNYDELKKAEEDYAKLEKASGDVTGDGKIGVGDVNVVLQAILGNVVLTDAQKVAADVNQDGKINVLDLVAMVALW